jgi:hypothetical protein
MLVDTFQAAYRRLKYCHYPFKQMLTTTKLARRFPNEQSKLYTRNMFFTRHKFFQNKVTAPICDHVPISIPYEWTRRLLRSYPFPCLLQ